MQLKAQRRMNQQLPVRLPSYRWCECTKLQHVSISCGWENECWRQWREIPQRWQQGHTWKVLLLQHVGRLSPCLCTYCFPGQTWNKNDLDNALLRFVLQKSRDENFIPGCLCTYPRIFLMSLLCSINCDRLQVHANIFFPVKACLDSPGIKKSSWSLYMLLWKVSEHLNLQFNAHTK